MPYLTRPRLHIAFVELTEGELEPRARVVCESTLFARLEAGGVSPEMIAINAAGCFLTIDERHVTAMRSAVASLNVAVHVRGACARVTLTRGDADWPLPSLAAVLIAIGAHDFEVIHITADATAVHVVVADTDVGLVSNVLGGLCRRVAPPSAA